MEDLSEGKAEKSQEGMAKNLCIIPARGGSRRIPRKNIRDFLGKPIIAYSIEVAINSGLFAEVMVSTDDEEIAAVAKNYGAVVPFLRSKENANDFAILADVVEEVLDYYWGQKKDFKYSCCILPTAPLIQLKHLEKAYEMLRRSGHDSVRPVVKFSYPIQRAVKLSGDNKVSFFYPEFDKTRSQDLDVAYHDAGQFYWFRSEKRLKGIEKFGFEIDPRFVQDIDNEEDWEMAEWKYSYLKKQK
jgi:N-acylneuraminate cytidylyltransferase